jgi:hypothetical protein
MKKLALSAAILMAATVLSCNRKDDDKKVEDKPCDAGTGGDLTLVAFLQHHTKPIFGSVDYADTVFVKFDSLDAPANNVYDTFYVGHAGEDHVHLTGLKCGSYYLFAAGYDTSIHQRVVGGIPFSTDKKDGEQDVIIPVTEGD